MLSPLKASRCIFLLMVNRSPPFHGGKPSFPWREGQRPVTLLRGAPCSPTFFMCRWFSPPLASQPFLEAVEVTFFPSSPPPPHNCPLLMTACGWYQLQVTNFPSSGTPPSFCYFKKNRIFKVLIVVLKNHTEIVKML